MGTMVAHCANDLPSDRFYAWATIVSPEDCNTTDTQQSSYWGGRPSATRNCDFAYRAPLGHTIKSEKPWSEKRQSETTTLRAYSR